MTKQPITISQTDLEKIFEITGVSRQDLIDAGLPYIQVATLDDLDMVRLASKMCDDYCNQMFWDSLRILVPALFSEDEKEKYDEEKWGFMAHKETEDRSMDSDPYEGDVDEYPY